MVKDKCKIENNFENQLEELHDRKVASPITNFVNPKKQKTGTAKKQKVHFCWNGGKIDEYSNPIFNIFKEGNFEFVPKLLKCLNQDGAIWPVKKKKGKLKRKGDRFKKAELIFVNFDLEVDEIISRFGDQLTAVFRSPKLDVPDSFSTIAVFQLDHSVSASFFELINMAFVEVHGSLKLSGPSQGFITTENGLVWAAKETQYLNVHKLLNQFYDMGNILRRLKEIFYKFDDFIVFIDLIMTLRSSYLPDLERFDSTEIERIEKMKPKSKNRMKPNYGEYWLGKSLGIY